MKLFHKAIKHYELDLEGRFSNNLRKSEPMIEEYAGPCKIEWALWIAVLLFVGIALCTVMTFIYPLL